MRTLKEKRFCLLLLLTIIYFSPSVFSQERNNFSYLLSCFNNSKTDTGDIEIDGIGIVKTTNITSDSIEAGLTYYDIPFNKRDRSASELAELATNRHIETWKNNSRIIFKKKYKIGSTIIIDLRLHLLIEDMYMQMIIIADIDKIYELMSFKDTDEKKYFADMTKRIKEKNCL